MKQLPHFESHGPFQYEVGILILGVWIYSTWFCSSSFYFSPFATKIDFRPELEFDPISRNVFPSKQEEKEKSETEGLTCHKWDTQAMATHIWRKIFLWRMILWLTCTYWII